MKVQVLNVEPRRYDPVARRQLEAEASVEWASCTTSDELLGLLEMGSYDAVFTRIGIDVGEEVLRAAPSLRWVATPTTGLDHIDCDVLRRHDVKVLSLRGDRALEHVSSTAEHAWSLLLAVMRRLEEARRQVGAGMWCRDELVATELRGRTLGVVGLGRLGRMVAGYGLAFGMRVLAHDVEPEIFHRAPRGVQPASLDFLLSQADVVSLHASLEPSTVGLLSAERIEHLKWGAVVINTARGELIDEVALLAALRAGRVAAAGLDVLAGDPLWPGVPPDDHPLLAYAADHPNVVITPHVGGCGRDAIAMTGRWLVDKFCAEVRMARWNLQGLET